MLPCDSGSLLPQCAAGLVSLISSAAIFLSFVRLRCLFCSFLLSTLIRVLRGSRSHDCSFHAQRVFNSPRFRLSIVVICSDAIAPPHGSACPGPWLIESTCRSRAGIFDVHSSIIAGVPDIQLIIKSAGDYFL